MDDISPDRRELLTQVAELYYIEGLSQEEIAKRIHVSRSNVSRMLKTCLEKKIVEIRINYSSTVGISLQNKIKHQFGVNEVIVVPAGFNLEETKLNVAKSAAKYLESVLKNDMSMGVAWGTTIYHLAQTFKPAKRLNIDVVQLIGGMGSRDLKTDGLELARKFAQQFNGRCYVLHAPLIVQNKVLKELLLEEPDISAHFEKAKKVDVAVVGIGSSGVKENALLRAGYITEEEAENLVKQGVVGNVCGNHIDINGNICPIELNERTIGIKLEDLKKIPLVIGIAAGDEKLKAILGSLRGRIINTLITDEATAMALLNFKG